MKWYLVLIFCGINFYFFGDYYDEIKQTNREIDLLGLFNHMILENLLLPS